MFVKYFCNFLVTYIHCTERLFRGINMTLHFLHNHPLKKKKSILSLSAPLENSPQIWVFGSKSEINDFARKTHFTCKYAETKPLPPWKIVLKYGFLDQNLKSMILPGKRILRVNMQKPNPHPLENSLQIWIFGSKSESNDFARKTHFTCTYAETKPLPPGK